MKSFNKLAAVDSEKDLLVIAPHALAAEKGQAQMIQVGRDVSGADQVLSFLRRGGRVLVLEQSSLAGLPLGASLVEHASTMTFPLDARHPLLKDIAPADLKFWRGDHYVTRMEVRRPAGNGGRAITVSGGSSGLDQAPVVELPAGAGVAVLIQALVGEKLKTEPVARRMFQNALDYLAAWRQAQGDTVVVSENGKFMDRLRALGVKFTAHAGQVAHRDLESARLLILHGGGAAIRGSTDAIKAFLHTGDSPKTVYWHAPDPETFEAVHPVFEAGTLNIVSTRGPVMIRKPEHHVMAGVAREDLAYRGKSRGPSWMRATDADPAVIDRALEPVIAAGEHVRIPAEQMEWQESAAGLSGAVPFAKKGGGILEFYRNGSASASLEMPRAGMYVLTVVAGGTPHGNIWPLVMVSVNNRKIAQVPLTGDAIRPYAVLADLPQGRSTIDLAFVNDAYGGGEDRNLFLAALLVGKKPVEEIGHEMLTLPAALSVIPVGPHQVVVDGVRWDTTRNNRVKADRYASVLLGNLGASFQPPHEVAAWVSARVFDVDGRFTQVSKQGGELQFYAYGEATARFECVRAGRYAVYVRGHSSPAEGVYARVEVSVDGEPVGEVDVPASSDQDFRVGIAVLNPGEHTVMVKFTNDRHAPPEDRNLFLRAVGFARTD